MRLPAQLTTPLLLATALAGCSAHKQPPPAPVALVPPPQLKQTPLYRPEMTKNAPALPPVPGTAVAEKKVEPEPPAQPDPNAIKKASRHSNTESTDKATGEEAATTEGTPTAGTTTAGTPTAGATTPAPAPQKPAASEANAPAPAQQASASRPDAADSAESPIGELTAGSTQDSAETKREAVDLIQSSRKGIQDMKRSLSGDEAKTLAQIRRFLDQAQKALDNGDTDGAFTLATKAKVLLDELTGGG